MKMLLLVPKIFPYSAILGNDVNVVAMASGMPRRRRTKIGATHKARLEFSLTAEHYDYLMAFWRLTRSETFACRMFTTNSHLQWYQVQWGGVPTITNHGGGVFTFACDITTASPIEQNKIIVKDDKANNGNTSNPTEPKSPPPEFVDDNKTVVKPFTARVAFYATGNRYLSKDDWERYVKASPAERKNINLTLLTDNSLHDNYLTLMNSPAKTTSNPEWSDYKGVIFQVALISNTERPYFAQEEDKSWAKFTNYTESRNFKTDYQYAREYEIKKNLVITRGKVIDNNYFYAKYLQEIPAKNPFNLAKLIDYKYQYIQQFFSKNPLDNVNHKEFILDHKPAQDGFYYLGDDLLYNFPLMDINNIRDVYPTNGVNHPNHKTDGSTQRTHIDGDIAIARPIDNIYYGFYVYEKQFNIGDSYFDIFPFSNSDFKDFQQVFDL